MKTRRQYQVGENIKRELVNVLTDSVIFKDVIINQVDASPDLRNAKVYVSLLDKDNAEKLVLSMNKEHSGSIRHAMAGALKNMRRIPSFYFTLDKRLDKALNINELLLKDKEIFD